MFLSVIGTSDCKLKRTCFIINAMLIDSQSEVRISRTEKCDLGLSKCQTLADVVK